VRTVSLCGGENYSCNELPRLGWLCPSPGNSEVDASEIRIGVGPPFNSPSLFADVSLYFSLSKFLRSSIPLVDPENLSLEAFKTLVLGTEFFFFF